MSNDFAPFAQAMPHVMALAALAEGACPHAISTIDGDSAIIAINSRLYLFGEMDFAAILQRDFFPILREKHEYLVVYAHRLPDGLSAVHEGMRVSLSHNKEAPLFDLKEGYQLVELDAALLARDNLENLDSLKQEMVSERLSIDDFMAKSFGLCLIKDEALVGWCLSEYNNQRGCEIGIEIAETHQRQGLGKALAAAFIQLARKRGAKTIGWHSWEANLPSVALAKSLSFELEAKDLAWVLRLADY